MIPCKLCYRNLRDKKNIFRNEYLSPTDIGRIASNFYVTYETIEMLNAEDAENNAKFGPIITDDVIIALVSKSSEFTQIKVREDEMMDIDELKSTGAMLPIRGGGVTMTAGKVNLLIQVG